LIKGSIVTTHIKKTRNHISDVIVNVHACIESGKSWVLSCVSRIKPNQRCSI